MSRPLCMSRPQCKEYHHQPHGIIINLLCVCVWCVDFCLMFFDGIFLLLVILLIPEYINSKQFSNTLKYIFQLFVKCTKWILVCTDWGLVLFYLSKYFSVKDKLLCENKCCKSLSSFIMKSIKSYVTQKNTFKRGKGLMWKNKLWSIAQKLLFIHITFYCCNFEHTKSSTVFGKWWKENVCVCCMLSSV